MLHYYGNLKYNSYMKRKKNIISAILIAIGVLCLLGACISFVYRYFEDRQSQEDFDALQPYRESLDAEDIDSSADEDKGLPKPPSESPSPVPQPTSTPEPTPVPVENPYKDAFLQNEDMEAWLQIPGTNIDYPVMWTPRDENFYLYKDFKGKKNDNGCLILDTDSSVEPLTTNLIIHGHNMRSGAMFGNLEEYEEQSYFEEHKNIILYTEEQKRCYEVIAVFRSQVYKKSEQVFKFYKFFQADTQEEFDDFYNNIKELSLYDTGVTAEFGDHFITLSTCTYHVKNGRFVVVAKEVESTEVYKPVREE